MSSSHVKAEAKSPKGAPHIRKKKSKRQKKNTERLQSALKPEPEEVTQLNPSNPKRSRVEANEHSVVPEHLEEHGSQGDEHDHSLWSGLEFHEESDAPAPLDTTVYKWTALRKAWSAKEQELRLKAPGKSIFEEAEYAQSKKQIFTQSEVSGMLTNTMLAFYKGQHAAQEMKQLPGNGFEIQVVDDNIFHWRIKFFGFPSGSDFQKDLQTLADQYNRPFGFVEVELRLDMNLFPFFPPQLRPIWPRLRAKSLARLITLDYLKFDKWSPVRSVTDVFSAIRQELIINGEVDMTPEINNPGNIRDLYPELEFRLWRLGVVTDPPFTTLPIWEAQQAAALGNLDSSSCGSTSSIPSGSPPSVAPKEAAPEHGLPSSILSVSVTPALSGSALDSFGSSSSLVVTSPKAAMPDKPSAGLGSLGVLPLGRSKSHGMVKAGTAHLLSGTISPIVMLGESREGGKAKHRASNETLDDKKGKVDGMDVEMTDADVDVLLGSSLQLTSLSRSISSGSHTGTTRRVDLARDSACMPPPLLRRSQSWNREAEEALDLGKGILAAGLATQLTVPVPLAEKGKTPSRDKIVHYGDAELSVLALKRQRSWSRSAAKIDVESYISYLAAHQQQTREILGIMALVLSELSTETSSLNFRFEDMLLHSSLLPVMAYHLSNDSICDIEKHIHLFTACLSICRGLAAHKPLHHLFSIPILPSLPFSGFSEISSDSPPSSPKPSRGAPYSPLRTPPFGPAASPYSPEREDDDPDSKTAKKEPTIKLEPITESKGEKSVSPIVAVSIISLLRVLRTRVIAFQAADDYQKSPDWSSQGLFRMVLQVVEEVGDAISRATDGTALKDTVKEEGIQTVAEPPPSIPQRLCPLCQRQISSARLKVHVKRCIGLNGRECPVCGECIDRSAVEVHVVGCVAKWVPVDTAKATDFDGLLGGWWLSRPGLSHEKRLSQALSAIGLSPAANVKREAEYNCHVCLQSWPNKLALTEHLSKCLKCPVCCRAIAWSDVKSHVDGCLVQGKYKSDDDEEARIVQARKEQGILNATQLAAVEYVKARAKTSSDAAQDGLLSKFVRNGLTEDDMKVVLRYIREDAPIVLHIHCDPVLEKLVKDGYYRNQFETNTSRGTLSHDTRRGWENRMYGGIYDSSSGFDRVKYGVLNTMNDPKGVGACSQYGDSYLLLQNVRLRTTFASKDSGDDSVELSSCEHYKHILNSFLDEELKEVFEVAAGIKQFGSSSSTRTYKEVQVHGPVKLNRDVKAIVVHPKHKGDKKMEALLSIFSARNFCSVVWMDSKHVSTVSC